MCSPCPPRFERKQRAFFSQTQVTESHFVQMKNVLAPKLTLIDAKAFDDVIALAVKCAGVVDEVVFKTGRM